MEGLVGADLDGMEKLQSDFISGADTLLGLIAAIDGGVQAINTLWQGADAADFVATWRTRHRPMLDLATQGLRTAAEVVERNRAQQEQTSAIDGLVAGSGTGNGGRPTTGPPNPGSVDPTVARNADLPGGIGTDPPDDRPTDPPADPPPADPPPAPATQAILDDYQIRDDEIIEWKPKLGGLPWVRAFWQDPIQLTATEGRLLDELASKRGLSGLNKFKDIRDQAFVESESRFTPTVREFMGQPISGNFDHTDAYRHTYWSALLAAEFGPDFARAFTQAHEGVPNNPADMEAMDLYNNEVGVRIAEQNPDASPDELADLVQEAVENGDVVVIDAAGDLEFSDEVPVGDTGVADDPPGEGDAPDEWDPGS